MEFFCDELGAQIDWRERPRFRDKELAAIGFGAAGNVMVVDKLVEVRLLDDEDRRVLIHIEVQAQRDAKLASRILDYNYRIFKEHRQYVASVVVLADEARHWRPCAYHHALLGTEMAFSFVAVKLLDYAVRSDELMASDNPFALVTLAHLRTQQARHDPDALYAAKLQLTRSLFQHGWRKRRIIILFRVINWMIPLPERYQQRYWQAVHKLEKERKMEWITPLEQSFMDKGWQKGLKKGRRQGLQEGRKLGLEQGREQGREQGLQQGLQRGLKLGALALLERQLTRRFGTPPKTVQRKLAKASLAQLEAWSDALEDADSLQQLFK